MRMIRDHTAQKHYCKKYFVKMVKRKSEIIRIFDIQLKIFVSFLFSYRRWGKGKFPSQKLQ